MTEKDNNLQDEILALAKAINKEDDLELEKKDLDSNFFLQNQKLFYNKTLKIPNSQDREETRSISDLAICYKKFHNPNIHNYEKNIELLSDEEQNLIDDFEKIRVISKMKDEYVGLSKNILQKINKDIDFAFISTGLTKLQLILLDDIFKLQENQLISPNLQENINFIRKNTDKKIVKKIKEVAKNFEDQQNFVIKTKAFLDFLKQESENKETKKEKEDEINKDIPNQDPHEENNQQQKKSQQSISDETETNDQKETKTIEQPQQELTELKEIEDFHQIKSNNSQKIDKKEIEFKNKYQIFTNKYDEVILPTKITDKEDLEVLRFNLNNKIEKLEKISKRLKIKLKKKLLAKQNITIEQSENEGILDRKKLTQIIANPFRNRLFIKENQHNYQDTIFTILLDNSGSMRGSPIVMSAMACEILAEILESFGVKTEILGFTTADWKGGKSRKLWDRSNRPENPGRINDLRHILYKSANQNFKKAKLNLGLMLKEGVLKENIDGEALLWARSRLLQREENRKILMVISDGTPVDDSTNSLNNKDILIDHLHHVISRIEKENKIELVGIGIGHNVDEFYKNSITIKNVEELGDVMISKLVDLI